MGVSSRILTQMTIVMNMELSMNSPPPIPRNKMVLQKGRTRLPSLLLDPCLMNMKRPKGFGLRQSTPHAMLQIGSIYTACSRRPLTSYWLEESQMCHISEFLDASVTSKRRDNILASSKEGVTLVSLLGTPQVPRHIGSTMNPPALLTKPMMQNLMKQMRDMEKQMEMRMRKSNEEDAKRRYQTQEG